MGVERQELPRRDRLSSVPQAQALSVGHALDVESSGVGAVHSVFANAVNLEIRDELWTLLSTDRADLPFGIRVASKRFDALGLRRGDAVHVRAGFVGIGSATTRFIVDCRAAPRWIPEPQDALAPGLADRLDIVAAAANARAWHGSAHMAHCVTAALNGPNTLADVLAGVLGRGPGSTPAGDDVLIGILAVLKSPHSGAAGVAAAESLRQAMLPLLSGTTDISGHLLRQAARGLFAQPVHVLLCALIGGSPPARLRGAVERVVETGATSGADMCLGILASAAAFLSTYQETATHQERAAA